MIWLLPYPFPLSRKQVVSLSSVVLYVCPWLSLLTEVGGGRGAKSKSYEGEKAIAHIQMGCHPNMLVLHIYRMYLYSVAEMVIQYRTNRVGPL
jgi:hypothetical protein